MRGLHFFLYIDDSMSQGWYTLGYMRAKKTVMCVGINGEKTEVPVEKLTFRPSVYAVITEGDKVLLSSQWDGWDFPGGGIHIDENLDEAFEREVKQETGLSVKRDKLLHVGESFFAHPDTGQYFHTILLFYTCKDISGTVSATVASSGEKVYVREAKWIPFSEVAALKFYNQVDSPALVRLGAEGKGM